MVIIKQLKKYRTLSIALLFVLLIQSCALVKLDTPSTLPTARDIEPFTTQDETVTPLPTQTLAVETPVSTETELPPTVVSSPKVKINAVNGNLFIRRGPDMAFNPISVLYKDTSAEVIARDLLSKWVQIKIPNSDKTGWASIQTKYSQVEGDLASVPEFTTTEWPVPAYLRNCTYHRMYVLPGEIYLNSYLGYPENEIWLYPGTYTVYDIDVPGDPMEVLQVDIREGSDEEIIVDGLGDHRHCP